MIWGMSGACQVHHLGLDWDNIWGMSCVGVGLLPRMKGLKGSINVAGSFNLAPLGFQTYPAMARSLPVRIMFYPSLLPPIVGNQEAMLFVILQCVCILFGRQIVRVAFLL